MDTYVLSIDVGNTHTVIGLFYNEEVIDTWRLSTNQTITSDELFLRISLLISSTGIDANNITHIGMASVVPALERVWIKALSKFTTPLVEIISSKNCLNLDVQYDNAALVGADRLCNVIAMRHMGYINGIAIDLGTATTFDIMKNGTFCGGVILPGIASSQEILTQKAVKLTPVSLEWTENVIAQNTEDAIRSGILYGFLGQLEFLVAKIRDELDVTGTIPVIATGGWSILLGEKTNVITSYDPILTLKGIRLVALG
ncbi:MAG: type III pantothenate kinase [Fibrobacterales bacterium]